MSSDPPFPSLDQGGIGQQIPVKTWELSLEMQQSLAAPPHHHSSGLCFVVSYALITSDCETIPFSSWEKAYPSVSQR